ncbi:MAG: class I SAM-dependent methyltransferase [Candidatus Pacebacteria bacterium]|nr:class I SAM-dependent methyltransferase [Candidatus Paceibacterota bacterium]MDD5555428.1 class I SAM-dependent methyltransferase [Candidatus Paceibacterota bacterium]
MDNKYIKYILDKLKEDYNKIAEKYSQVREKEWREMEFLFDSISENDKVLDLGCGSGRFYPLFEKRKADYYGIDFSAKMIEIAKEKYSRVRFWLGTGFSLAFEYDFFDKVYVIAVLHHVPSKELRLKFLEEAKRVLKNKGRLVLTVWDLKEKQKFSFFKNKNLDQGDILLPWYGAEDCYFHKFSLRELEELASAAGLKIIEKGEIMVGERPYTNFYLICEKNEAL